MVVETQAHTRSGSSSGRASWRSRERERERENGKRKRGVHEKGVAGPSDLGMSAERKSGDAGLDQLNDCVLMCLCQGLVRGV